MEADHRETIRRLATLSDFRFAVLHDLPRRREDCRVEDFALSLQNKLQSEIDAERDVDDAYILAKKYKQKLPKPNWAEVALNKSKAKK